MMTVETNSISSIDPQTYTLLIVDDEPAVLAVATEYLVGYGFEILIAQNGEKALQRSRYAQPDLILLDVQMPGIDGFETCRRLKADERTREIPVIFMTALARVEDKVKGFEVGGLDYITKPFQHKEVLARIVTHLRMRDLTRRLEEANESLERQVEERTAALTQANKDLQAEIAERKHAEAALRDSEERLRLTMDAANIGSWDWDVENDIWYASPIYYTMLGYEPKAGPGDHHEWLARVHPDDRAFVAGSIQDVLTRDFKEHRYEARLRHADGTYRWQYVHGLGIERDEKGNVIRMLGIRMDITERKRAEEALHRLNRELRAISECNQVLIRADDEQTLLNDICRIICDEAGYRMAWVGYAEQDEAKSVRPVAWAGVEEGYLAVANITWADTERGRGPTGTAIRTGESASIQDFTIDPQASPWRENALPHGYRSSIALPLKDKNTTAFGALCIYSTEPNTFTPDEIQLLEELAGNLAFGVTTLRTRTERRQAEDQIRKLNIELEQRVLDRTAQLEAANQELRESEARMRTLIDNLPIEFWAMDNNLCYIMQNAVSYRNDGPVVGKRIENLGLPPEVATQWVEQDKKVLAGETLHNEYEKDVDGEKRAYLNIVAPVKVDEAIIGIVGAAMDITAQKRVEDKIRKLNEELEQRVRERTEQLEAMNRSLRESEQQYRLLFENSPISIWEEDFSGVKTFFDDLRQAGVTDLETYLAQHPETIVQCAESIRVIDVNQAAIVLHEAVDKEQLFAGLPDLFSPEFLDILRHELIALWNGETETAFATEGSVKTFSGDVRTVMVSLAVCPGYEETLARIFASIIDITERKQAEEDLRASEARYRILVEHAADAFFLQDAQSTILDVNRQACESLGYNREELIGMAPYDFDVNAAPSAPDQMVAQLDAGEVITFDTQHRRKDGSVFPVEVRIRSFWQDERRFDVSLARDITEHKLAADRIRKLNEELEQRVVNRTRELSAIYGVTAVASESLNLETTLKRSLEQVLAAMPSKMGVIYLLEETDKISGEESLHMVVQQGIPANITTRKESAPLGKELAVWTVKHHEALIVPDVTADSRVGQMPGIAPQTAYVGVPIRVREQVLGAIGVFIGPETQLKVTHMSLLTSIADHVGVVVESARLRQRVEQTAVLEERGRLARELHDSVTQLLYSINLFAKAGRDAYKLDHFEQGDKYLSRLEDTTSQAVKEMRLLLYELRPPELEQEGLLGTIQLRLDAVEGRAGVKTQLLVNSAVDIPKAIEGELYYLIQEALNNVLKHARATSVTIEIEADRDQISVKITDDGVGFDPDSLLNRGGMGLVNMRERTEKLGGELTVLAEPEKGSTIQVYLKTPGVF